MRNDLRFAVDKFRHGGEQRINAKHSADVSAYAEEDDGIVDVMGDLRCVSQPEQTFAKGKKRRIHHDFLQRALHPQCHKGDAEQHDANDHQRQAKVMIQGILRADVLVYEEGFTQHDAGQHFFISADPRAGGMQRIQSELHQILRADRRHLEAHPDISAPLGADLMKVSGVTGDEFSVDPKLHLHVQEVEVQDPPFHDIQVEVSADGHITPLFVKLLACADRLPRDAAIAAEFRRDQLQRQRHGHLCLPGMKHSISDGCQHARNDANGNHDGKVFKLHKCILRMNSYLRV